VDQVTGTPSLTGPRQANVIELPEGIKQDTTSKVKGKDGKDEDTAEVAKEVIV